VHALFISNSKNLRYPIITNLALTPYLFPLETKASATLLPGHAKALNKWRNLAGEETVKGVIVANIDNPMEVSGCRVISWKHAL